MYYVKNHFLVIVVMISSYAHGMNSRAHNCKSIAVSVDIDGVMSETIGNEAVGQQEDEFLSKALLSYQDEYPIRKYIYASCDGLEAQHCAYLQRPAGSRVWLEYPIMPIVKMVKTLRKRGYTVIAATNQCYKWHVRYRDRIKEQANIDYEAEFDGVLTILPKNDEGCEELSYARVNTKRNVYMVGTPNIGKPMVEYYQLKQSLIAELNPEVTSIIHIDDQLVNVQGAIRAGIQGIHFNVGDKSFVDAKLEDLDQAVANVKEQLKTHGVLLDE